YRIAVIGDSFTFATQMQFEDSFPKVLERMLKLNTNGKAVEVLNFGVPGYSTTHEVGAFRHIRKYSPDMILLQITLNDPQLKPYVPTGITGQNEFGAVSADGLNGLSRYWKTWAFIQMRLHNTRTHTRYKTYYHQLFSTNSQTYRNFQEALDSLSKKAAKQNIAVAAVVFPLFGLPLNDSYPFEDIHEKIASDLERSKITYLDLLDAYKGIPLERLQLIPGVDFHPNEIGHRIAAERIYEWFHQEKSIPQDLTESERFRDRLNIVPEKNNPVS
ncbi:MAG: SGNH/GDSL hydrolase family protein, partial [Bdellovibrionales bacterium]|nr:SGNH/GDSL hydrolase family protein [Bdellovibrionales bacterium]